ncbi:MAG: PIN domain nuclease [bacterium]|nr:PIN domain nuclease [bacterium]
MTCADTNCWIAYLAGEVVSDVNVLDVALADRTLVMSPVVLSELLSDPKMPPATEKSLLSVHLLEPTEGFWGRAGKLRASLIGRGYKPKLADTLIAQSCLDYDAALLTRDRGFGPFAKHAGLVLL